MFSVDIKEREEGGENEKHRLVTSHMRPDQGSNSQPFGGQG